MYLPEKKQNLSQLPVAEGLATSAHARQPIIPSLVVVGAIPIADYTGFLVGEGHSDARLHNVIPMSDSARRDSNRRLFASREADTPMPGYHASECPFSSPNIPAL